jgi:hypothetical protein
MTVLRPALHESENARRSALLLHGLAASDQGWLLERLTVAQREQVSTLLQELRSLGIPADAGAAIQLLNDSRTAQKPTEAYSVRAVVAAASPARLAAVLKEEPAGLVAHLLLADRWGWQAAFLALQTPNQRRRIQELLHTSVSAPKLAEAVVEEIAQRLTAAPASQQPERLGSSWRVWIQRLVAHGAGREVSQ